MLHYPPCRAMIAEDEPILAAMLQHALTRLWPNMRLGPIAENGIQAVQRALTEYPEILFLDIKMPGKTGLEVAQELAEEWPQEQPFPLLVFVTAYDEYALQAFDLSAVDYLLKPINDERLQRALERLQQRLQQRQTPVTHPAPAATPGAAAPAALDPALLQLVQSLQVLLPQAQALNGTPTAATAASEPLRIIKAAVGNQVKMIPVSEVIYFEATDKYVNVVCADSEALIRTSLRELAAQLDANQFWQVHRSTIVNSDCILAAVRDELGKLSLKLRGRNESVRVSPVYAHLFKQM